MAKDLENAEIVVSNITLREEPFKQYNVRVTPDDEVIRYSIPIKKKDGGLYKSYEVYKLNKAKLDESFAEDKLVKMKVVYKEKAVETQGGLRKYRNIVLIEIMAGEGEQPRIENAATPPPDEMKIEDIPF